MSFPTALGKEAAGGANHRRRRWVIFGVAALLIVAAVFVSRGAGQRGPSYDTRVVKRGDIEINVSALGTLQPRNYVDVGAQVSGQILKLHVQMGDVVRKDQLLAEIDPSVQQAVVDAGRAALASLRAQLADHEAQWALANYRHEQQRNLSRQGLLSEEQLKIAEATFRSAEAKVAQLKALIEQTQSTLKADEARLGYTRIYAPMAGTVVSLEAREGQTLNASQQAPLLLRVADLSTMTVWTEVSEADIKRVQAGMPVYFTTLGIDGRRWESVVRQILPAPYQPESARAGQSAAPSKVVLYTVLFDLENADGALMPQMTAQVFFVSVAARGALLVPVAALRKQNDADEKHGVLVFGGDAAHERREVKVGVRDRLFAEIVSGLTEGEVVVVGELEAEAGRERFRL